MMPTTMAPPEPSVPTSGHGEPPAVTRRRSHVSGAIALIGVVIVLVAIIFGYLINRNQNQQIATTSANTSALTSALNQQNAIIEQVCQIAGGQVSRNAQASEACGRVAAGQPAVPQPAATGQPGANGANGTNGANGIGIDHVEQDGTCYINVILTNHSTSRFGPFCGADGATGPSGADGATGASGAPGVDGKDGQNGADGKDGAQGVGIASITDSADRCYVTVALTNSTTQTIGPFCGSPAVEITMTLSGGIVQDCARSGGDDAHPAYSCSVPAPTTTTTTGAPPT